MDDVFQKKRKRKPHWYTEIRNKKLRGEPHQKHCKNEIRPAAKIGPDCKCKRLRCFEVVNEEMRETIFHDFYTNFRNKNEADAHLTGLINLSLIKQRKPRVTIIDVPVTHTIVESQTGDDDLADGTIVVEGVNPNSASFSYKVRFSDRDIPVCFQAFLSIHGVTRARIRRLQNHLITEGCSPRDKRGTHDHHYRQMPAALLFLIEYQIAHLRKKQSHYSIKDNPEKYYLHEDLTSIADVHRLFLDDYRINVPYKTYHLIFNQFNLGFGIPSTDTCATCDEFIHKMKLAKTEAELEALKGAKDSHLRLNTYFKNHKKKYVKQAKRGTITLVTFDFMQNLPIPNLRTNDVYYRTQVRVYVFGVHDVGTGAATMYVYDEQNGGKGADNVCSMLFHYFRRLSYKPLVLICDNCPGQNKNKTLIRFLYLVVHVWKIVPSVTVMFPIRGRSYLYNDGDFGKIDKNEACETPTEWMQLIRDSRVNPSPFEVEEMKFHMFYNFTTVASDFFLPKPKPAFQIKLSRMIRISNTTTDTAIRYGYNTNWGRVIVKNNRRLPDEIALSPLYSNELQISDQVKKNMKHLFKFTRNPDSRAYYEQFLNNFIPTRSGGTSNWKVVRRQNHRNPCNLNEKFQLKEFRIVLDDISRPRHGTSREKDTVKCTNVNINFDSDSDFIIEESSDDDSSGAE